MAPNFTLRTIFVAMTVIAVGLAALFYPSTRVAIVVVNGVLIAVLVAACLAVGMRNPTRSFWLGFMISCSGALVLDELGRRHVIRLDVFTHALAAMVEETLPPIVHRGEPGTTRYFRSAGKLPIEYHRFGADGTRTGYGQMRMEQARRDGAFEGGVSLQDLPHIDNVPTSYMRSQMLPYVVAVAIGLVGGGLSYFTRRLSVS